MAVPLAAACSNGQAATSNDGKAAPASEQKAQAPQRSSLVVAFGDSLYAGYGLTSSQSFPAALQRALGSQGISAEVINAGVSGETTAGGRNRIGSVLDRLKRKPDLVMVGLGANDVFRGFSPQQTRANLEAIILELKRRGIPVMLTGIAAPAGFQHPYLARFEGVYADLARRHGVALEPSFLDGVITNRKYLLADGVHPNAAGVSRMAERVAPQVAAVLRP
jgi:acyl-CoA thioesterase-1